MKFKALVVGILMLSASGCSGSDGSDGQPGQSGTPCWVGLSDVNGDGVVDALDCRGRDGTNGEPGANGQPGENGEPGTAGDDGLDCWDLNDNGVADVDTEDANGDGVVDVLDCHGKDGKSEGNAAPELTAAEVAAIEGRAGVAECLACHKGANPNMVKDFVYSPMAISGGVACVDCHEDNPAIAAGEGHRFFPKPETCKACHPNEYAGHRANRHSVASIRNYECGRFDDFPRVFDNGSGYHFNDQDVAQLQALMNSGSNGAGADYNPTAIAKCMQCHNVENRCDSCHTRHRFSKIEARNPAACATCHMGPDHSQYEMYETSKHGAMHASEGDTYRVPVCVDCHMPFNDKILPKKTDVNTGEPYVAHDLSSTIAYGPVGGGTVRKGFVAQDGRVKFVSKEPAGVAEHDELWYAWEDGKVYTTPTGTAVAYDDIYTMSIQDKDGNGKQDYLLVQPDDAPAKLVSSRATMLAVCNRCHANNFADERLLVADLIHENTKKTEGEAFDLVMALAAADIGQYSNSDTPPNPETGDNGYGASMKVRNLTELEREYFHVMKYDQVTTWKGAYHFNPDFTHWYGWTAVNLRLGAMGDIATQQVLTDLWVRGLDYPGPNHDPWTDGLYQGVFFVTGMNETVQNENYYDKFPGPDDGYLDWYNAATHRYDDGGDGIPDNQQDVDIDMDGTADLVKTDGSGGTLAAGVYRAIATGKVITLH